MAPQQPPDQDPNSPNQFDFHPKRTDHPHTHTHTKHDDKAAATPPPSSSYPPVMAELPSTPTPPPSLGINVIDPNTPAQNQPYNDPAKAYHNGSGHISRMSRGVLAGAGVVAAIVTFIALLCFTVGFCRRRRRRKMILESRLRREEQQRQMMMMAKPSSPVVNAFVQSSQSIPRPSQAPPQLPPPAVLAPPLSSSTTSSIPSSSAQTPEPIILSTTMDQNYYTGIDTSDGLSVADSQTHPSNTVFMSAAGDEPPPPYRPRSVPPVSRENSVRVANGMVPGYAPRASLRKPPVMQSPFADPVEEGGSLGESSSRRSGDNDVDDDGASVTSNFSFQREPMAVRSAI